MTAFYFAATGTCCCFAAVFLLERRIRRLRRDPAYPYVNVRPPASEKALLVIGMVLVVAAIAITVGG